MFHICIPQVDVPTSGLLEYIKNKNLRWLRGKDFQVSYLRILPMGVRVSRKSIQTMTVFHPSCPKSVFLIYFYILESYIQA